MSKTITTVFTYSESSNIFNMIKQDRLQELRATFVGKPLAYINELREDSNDNTLLHVATQCRNIAICKYLLYLGMDKHRKNVFYDSPWTLAIATHCEDLIQAFIDVEMDSYVKYKTLADKYDSDNKTLRELNTQLQHANEDITIKYNNELLNGNNERNELIFLKENGKRLREENDRLKHENNDLTAKNKKLKIAVDNLTKIAKR